MRLPLPLRRFWYALKENCAGEILDQELKPQVIAELLRERVEKTILETNPPTVECSYVCLDCGIVQGQPVNFKCHTCTRGQLVDVSYLFDHIVIARPRKNRLKAPVWPWLKVAR